MSVAINKVMIIGEVVKKPHVSKDNKIIKLKIETITDQTEEDGSVKTIKEFHKVVAEERFFNAINKLVEKGTVVFIEGSLSYDKKEESYPEIILGRNGKLQVLSGFKKSAEMLEDE